MTASLLHIQYNEDGYANISNYNSSFIYDEKVKKSMKTIIKQN